MLRKKGSIVYPELSYLLYGLFFKVHNQLGRFRSEKQYGDALEHLLRVNNVPYVREARLPPSFPGEETNRNIVDFFVEDKIIVELKAKPIITKEDYFQTKRYLASADKRLARLVNFRQKFLTPKRILH